MPTKLDRPLKRELKVKGEAYVLTISPEGLKLTQKGRRKGQELTWKDLVSGEAALAVALSASLEKARRSPSRGGGAPTRSNATQGKPPESKRRAKR